VLAVRRDDALGAELAGLSGKERHTTTGFMGGRINLILIAIIAALVLGAMIYLINFRAI
jgi:hypothetical protein